MTYQPAAGEYRCIVCGAWRGEHIDIDDASVDLRCPVKVTPNEALLQAAYIELMARPNITVYDHDGQNRRPANPFGELLRGLAKTAEAVGALTEQLEQVFAGFRQRALLGP